MPLHRCYKEKEIQKKRNIKSRKIDKRKMLASQHSITYCSQHTIGISVLFGHLSAIIGLHGFYTYI